MTEADNRWNTYIAECDKQSQALNDDSEFKVQALKVWAVSDFAFQKSLKFLNFVHSNLFDEFNAAALEKGLGEQVQRARDMPQLQTVLRDFRNKMMLFIAWHAITKRYGVKQTCEQLSLLADILIRTALTHLKKLNSIDVDLGVIAMGKLGGFELNFSSDIDLIFILFKGDEAEALAITRDLIKALDEQTADGFVYRVDTRLRPFGDMGPLVMREQKLLDYYAEHGRDWERYAMMKGRFVIKSRSRFLKRVHEYIFHSYTDYTVRQEILSLYGQIQVKMRKSGMKENIKLGPGGIREAEFIVQSLQLLHAGRLKALREPSFLKALTLLAANKVISDHIASQLEEAYLFLRDVENIIQMQNDRQTQALPRSAEQMHKLALGCGFEEVASFKSALADVRKSVVGFREKLLDLQALPKHKVSQVPVDADPFVTIKAKGDCATILNQLKPHLISVISAAEDKALLTSRLYDVIKAVSARKTYLALMLEQHKQLPRLAKLFEQSDLLSKLAVRIPRVLSMFLSAEDSEPLNYEHLKQRLTKRVEAEPDLEQKLDVLRDCKQAQFCRIAISDLENVYPIMRVSDFLSELAVSIIHQVEQLVWQHQVDKRGFPDGLASYQDHGFAVIAYGKLGGLELSYSSDLDLVFLYQTAGNGEFYAKLIQRFVGHCQAKTLMGDLYTIDARLRPSGSKGLLVSHIDAFEKYQLEEAWTWEHQALLRARPIFANMDLNAQFDAIRQKVLCQQRDPTKLKDDVLKMRSKMREAKLKKTSLIDLKQIEGGIVDIEFMVQYLGLLHAHQYPEVVRYTDNIRILEALAENKLIEQAMCDELCNIYRRYRNRQHRYTLTRDEKFLQPDLFPEFRAYVCQVWSEVFA